MKAVVKFNVLLDGKISSQRRRVIDVEMCEIEHIISMFCVYANEMKFDGTLHISKVHCNGYTYYCNRVLKL